LTWLAADYIDVSGELRCRKFEDVSCNQPSTFNDAMYRWSYSSWFVSSW